MLAEGGACGCDLSAYYQEMIKREKALKGGPAEYIPPPAWAGSSLSASAAIRY